MRPLPQKLDYHGFSYTLICRTDKVAIYEQRVTEKIRYYEVFEIKKIPDKYIMGKLVPAHEKWPRDEDFGYSAWTYYSLDKAIEKLLDLNFPYRKAESKIIKL